MKKLGVLFTVACGYTPPKFSIKHVEKRGRLDHNGESAGITDYKLIEPAYPH